MGRHKKPPQGAQSIVNLEAQEHRLEAGAANLLDDLGCYMHVRADPLWQRLIETTKDQRVPLFAQLNAKYTKAVIGRAFRWWRYNH